MAGSSLTRVATSTMADRNYAAIRSAEKFEMFVDRIISAGTAFGFDLESGYLGDPLDGLALMTFHPRWMLVGFSFTNSPDWARYVPIAHDDGDNVDDIPRTARALWRLLQSGLGVAHHLSFEMKGLSRWFREVLGDDPKVGAEVTAAYGMFPYLSDSMVEAFLTSDYPPLGTSGGVGIGLKSLVKHIFGHQMTEFLDLFDDLKPAMKKKVRFNTLSLTPKVITYACEDSVWCLSLHIKHYPELKDTFIYKVEMALIPVLVEMEHEGLLLDWPEISRKAAEVLTLQGKLNEEIQANLSERVGEIVNINLGSSKQVADMLFNRLGLEVKMRSEKTNEPSTSEKALRVIAKSDPVLIKILQYREVTKLYGSYLHKYETQLNYAGTGRAYPNHNQCGAGTGRTSVDGVSYQQWPKPYHYELEDHTTFDLNFKNLLLSPSEYRVIGFDYSQVELRILAGQANETAMLHAFATGVDIHKATAAAMMKLPLSDITKALRSRGKTLNFASVYQSGPGNIADMLTTPDSPVTKEDAEKLLANYFAAYPALRTWMDTKIAEGHQQGYVKTMFGRKYTVWEFKSDNNYIRSKGDRMCVNAPIQGGAADYAKTAMVRVSKAIKKAGMQDKIRMVMMIHDALEFYVHESVSTQKVLDLLGPEVSFFVPGLPEIRADWHEGPKWGTVAEIVRDAQGQIVSYGLEDDETSYSTLEAALAALEAKRAPSAPPVAVVEPAVEAEPERACVLTISTMPEPNTWELFKGYLTKHRGQGGVTLITPEGETPLSGYTLTKEDQPAVSSLLGGASMSFVKNDAEDDFADLVA